jgi:hypothetical protein
MPGAEFTALSRKLRASIHRADVERSEQAAERIYNAGLLTVNQYSRLCVIAFDTLAQLDAQPQRR